MTFPSPAASNYQKLSLPYRAGIISHNLICTKVDENGNQLKPTVEKSFNAGSLVLPLYSVGTKLNPNTYIQVMTPDGMFMIRTWDLWLTASAGLFSGMTFCITGELTWLRNVYITLIEIEGGTYKPSVTRDVTHVIRSNTTVGTGKIQKAKEKGVKIWTESEFLTFYKKAVDRWAEELNKTNDKPVAGSLSHTLPG